MDDPKPVYKDGVLIGYTYDGSTMVPVKDGAKAVSKNGKLIGITYDGSNMEDLSSDQPSIVKKKETTGATSVGVAPFQDTSSNQLTGDQVSNPDNIQPVSNAATVVAAATPAVPTTPVNEGITPLVGLGPTKPVIQPVKPQTTEDLNNTINDYVDQATAYSDGWLGFGATNNTDLNKSVKASVFSGDVAAINDVQNKTISRLEQKRFDLQKSNYVLNDVPVGSPIDLTTLAQKSQLDDIDNEIQKAKQDFYSFKANAIVAKNIKSIIDEAADGKTSSNYIDPIEVGQQIEEAGIDPKDFTKRQALYESAKNAVQASFSKTPEVSPLESTGMFRVIKNNGYNQSHSIDINKSMKTDFQNMDYERESTGLNAILNYTTTAIGDLKSKGQSSDNPQQYEQQINVLQTQLDDAKNKSQTILQRHPDVWVAQTARLVGDELSDMGRGKLGFYTDGDIRDAVASLQSKNPDFVPYNQDAVNQLTTSMIPKPGFLGAAERSISGIGHNIETLFGNDTKQSVEVARQYDPSLMSTSKGGGVETSIVLGNNGKTYAERPNENYHAFDLNNGLRFLGGSLPNLAEFFLLTHGFGAIAGAVSEVGATGMAKLAMPLVRNLAEGFGADLSAEELAGVNQSLIKLGTLGEKGKDLAGLTGTMYATSYAGFRQQADDLIDDNSAAGEAKKNLLAHLMVISSVVSFSSFGVTPTSALENIFGRSVLPDMANYADKEGLQKLTTDGIDEGFFKGTILPKAQSIFNSLKTGVTQGAQLGKAMVLDENVRGLLAKAVNPQVGTIPTINDDLNTAVEQIGLMTLLGGLGGFVNDKSNNTFQKDVIYHMGLNHPSFENSVQDGIKSGRYSQEQGDAMISFIKTVGEEAYKAQNLTTSNGLPLTTKQKRDATIANVKARSAALLKEQGVNTVDADAAKNDAINLVANMVPKFDEVVPENNADGSVTMRPVNQQDIDARWRTDISKIDSRTDINDQQKEELKKQRDDIHSQEVSALPKTPVVADAAQPQVAPKPVYTDFDGTLWDGEKLTVLGEGLKQKIADGEDVNVVTARADTPETKQFIADKLGIDQSKISAGLTPEGKAQAVKEGSVFYDNNPDNLKAVREADRGVEIVDSNTLTPGNANSIETVLSDKLGKEKTDAVSKTVNEFVDNGVINDSVPQTEKDDAKASPLSFLKTVSDQAQAVDNIGGKEVSTRQPTIDKYGDQVVKLAEETFPKENAQTNEPIDVQKAIDEATQAKDNPELQDKYKVLANGVYQKSIEAGKMTANDAKTILESASVKVPQDILEKAKNEKANPKEIAKGNEPLKTGESKPVNETTGGKSEDAGKTKNKIESARQATKDFAKKYLSATLPEGTKTAGLSLDKVIDAVFDTIQKAYDAGKKISDAIKEGLDHLRSEGSFKALAPDQQKQIEDHISNEFSSQATSTDNPEDELTEGDLDDTGEINSSDPHNADDAYIEIQKKSLGDKVQKALTFTKTWKEIFDNALDYLGKAAKRNNRTLTDQAEAFVNFQYKRGFDKDGNPIPGLRRGINLSSEEAAIVVMHLGELDYKIRSTTGWENGEFGNNSLQDIKDLADLESKKEIAELVLRADESGRRLGFQNLVYKLIDGTVELSRKKASVIAGMDIPKSDAEFEALSDEDKKKIGDLYNKFKQYKADQDAFISVDQKSESRNSAAEFENKVQEEVTRRLKEKPGTVKSTKSTLSERGKSLADNIRKLKSPPGSLKFDFTLGTFDVLVEGVAKLVEAGATIAEAVGQLIKEGKISFSKDKDRDDAINYMADSVTKIFNRDTIGNSIKELSDKEKSSTITQSAVRKGLVTDFVHSFIGEADTKDVLNSATEALKEKYPDITKEQVADAYLKKGQYKPDTSEGLKTEFSKSAAEVRAITNTQRDIDALKAGQEIDKNPKQSSRIIGEYEQKLKDEKQSLLDGKKAAEKAIVDAQKERDRAIKKAKSEQDRVQALRDKVSKLSRGILEKNGGKTPKTESPEIEGLKKTLATLEEDLRASEAIRKKAIRDADNTDKKSKEIDTRISDLDAHQKLWDSVKGKKTNINKTLADKNEQLRQALIKNGKRLEYGSKDDRATKQEVVDAHNETISSINDSINDKLSDDSISDEDKLSLSGIQSKLDDLKINATDKENISDKIERGIKTVKDFVDANKSKNPEVSDIVGQLKGSMEDLQKNHQFTLDQIQLKREIDTNNRRQERAQRKLNAGEFDDRQQGEAKKTPEWYDAQYKAKLSEAAFRKSQMDYAEKNKSLLQKVFSKLRRFQVANLISGMYSFGKVFLSGIVKPASDFIVRYATAPIIHPIGKFLGMGKAIERQRISPKAEFKSFRDSYVGMSNKKATELLTKTEDNLENAKLKVDKKYDELNDIGDKYGYNSKEYNDFKNSDIQDAKNDFNLAKAEYYSNLVYKFISPNSWGERWEKLKHGASKFEQSMGDIVHLTSLAEEKGPINKTLYVLESFARSHGVMKDLSARQSFMEGYLKRIEKLVDDGQDITPIKVQEVVLRSYMKDFLEGKYQEKNILADKIRNLQTKGNNDGWGWQVISFFSESLTPVLKIPLNIEKAGVFKYTLGTVAAAIRTGNEISKALKLNKLEENQGKTFLEVMRQHMGTLDPKVVDKIYEYASKGLIGLVAITYFGSGVASGSIVYGGQYVKGQKKRRFLNSDGQWETLDYGQLAMNGHKVPKWICTIVGHLPETMPIILTANVVQSYKDDLNPYSRSPKDKANAALYSFGNLVGTIFNESPLGNIGHPDEYLSDILTSYTTQSLAKNISEIFDRDKDGNLIERQPLNIGQEIMLRTGLRQFLPTKDEAAKSKALEQRENIQDNKKAPDPYYLKNKKQ